MRAYGGVLNGISMFFHEFLRVLGFMLSYG